jgi:LPS export ABC transporter protein LptC
VDRKSIFLALFIFIIIIFSLYFTFQENQVFPPETGVENEELAEEELENVSFSIFDNQQEYQLKLKSEKVENYKNENRMELSLVGAEVYSLNSGELLYKLRGDTGSYYSSENYLKIRGNVMIEGQSYQIKADELDYYLNRNYLEGKGSVEIIGSGFNSKAETFNSNLDLKNLELSGNNQQARINFDEFN